MSPTLNGSSALQRLRYIKYTNVRIGGRPAVVDHVGGRPLISQARGVLGSTPRNCRLFHFPLFSPPKFIYFQCEARCS